jgi:hypothetical protein
MNVVEGSSKSKGGFMATTKVGIAPMTVAQIPAPGADFQIVEREIPEECDLSRHSTEVFGACTTRTRCEPE